MNAHKTTVLVRRVLGGEARFEAPCHVVARSPDLIALVLPTETKRACAVGHTHSDDGVPMITIWTGQETNNFYEVSFPEFAGFDIFSTEADRHSLLVVLIRSGWQGRCRDAEGDGSAAVEEDNL